MTKRSIFAKIFLITFALFSGLVILLHASVYFIFPSTYIESQRQTILKKSQALAKSFQGQEEGTIESVIDLYSKTNDIKVSIKGKEKQNALEVKDDLLLNPNSQNNSLVIEERKIQTKEGKDLTLQFLATVDSQKEARDISLGFLPYSLLASFVLSLIASYLYARMISAPILEIKQMTKRMKRLDRTASLPIHSQDEIGVLKQQINDLYHHLLEVIDNLEQQHQEHRRKRHAEAPSRHIAEHRADCRAKRRKTNPRYIQNKTHAGIKRHIECRQTCRLTLLNFSKCHCPAFITHKKQRGHRLFQRHIPHIRRNRRTHQDMARINHKRYRCNQQNRQRICPQIDCGEFRTSGKIHARHQQHFQPTHALLPTLHTQNQRPRQQTDQHGRGFFDTTQKFRLGRSSVIHFN